jgi:hypothetical protein
MQDQRLKSPPVQEGLLTAQAERPPPEPDGPSLEGAESIHITRHCVVVEVALHDRPQPLTCPCDGLVPALAQLLVQRIQLGHHSLASGLASDDKVAGLPVPFADMREAQKVGRFRLAFSAPPPVCVGVWSKLDQTRVVRVDFQAELLESCLHVRQEPFGVLSAFETNHVIIRAADDHDISLGGFLAPGSYPEIEPTVEIGSKDGALRHHGRTSRSSARRTGRVTRRGTRLASNLPRSAVPLEYARAIAPSSVPDCA